MAINNFCSCVTCDTEFYFGAFDADQDCPGSPSLSQVCAILIKPEGATGPIDWTVKTDWESAVDNTDTANNFVKYLSGVGSIDTPDKTTLTVAKGQVVTTIRLYTLQMEVFNLSNTQYETLRKIQCNPTNYTFWVENIGGHIFGGSLGISPTLTDVDFPLGSGDEDIERAVLTIQWRAKCDPERTYINNLSENFSGAGSISRILGFSATEVFGNSVAEVHGY